MNAARKPDPFADFDRWAQWVDQNIADLQTRLAKCEAQSAPSITIKLPTRTIDAVINEAARRSDLTVESITGAYRGRSAYRVRSACAWVGLHILGYSSPRVGLALGGRDHSTILYAEIRCARAMAADAEFADFVGALARFAQNKKDASS